MKVLRYMHCALITLFLVISFPIVGLLVVISKMIGFKGFCTFKELFLIWTSACMDEWKRVDNRE